MYAYTKQLRLSEADEFSSVFVLGQVKRGIFFKIHYYANGFATGYSRLGLIVSKKIHKRAYKRNYMKRLIRELFRHAQVNWLAHDIIVRVQKCFTHEEYQLVKDEFIRLTQGLNQQ